MVKQNCKPSDIPNAFSPNGDGANDTSKIIWLGGNNAISVYKRHGALVFESKGYKAWDRKINNSDAPGGVYYYIIKLTNGNKPLNGTVTVVR